MNYIFNVRVPLSSFLTVTVAETWANGLGSHGAGKGQTDKDSDFCMSVFVSRNQCHTTYKRRQTFTHLHEAHITADARYSMFSMCVAGL